MCYSKTALTDQNTEHEETAAIRGYIESTKGLFLKVKKHGAAPEERRNAKKSHMDSKRVPTNSGREI